MRDPLELHQGSLICKLGSFKAFQLRSGRSLDFWVRQSAVAGVWKNLKEITEAKVIDPNNTNKQTQRYVVNICLHMSEMFRQAHGERLHFLKSLVAKESNATTSKVRWKQTSKTINQKIWVLLNLCELQWDSWTNLSFCHRWQPKTLGNYALVDWLSVNFRNPTSQEQAPNYLQIRWHDVTRTKFQRRSCQWVLIECPVKLRKFSS